MPTSAEERSAALLQARIIAIALIMGPALFLGVAYFLRSGGAFDQGYEDRELYTPEEAEDARALDEKRNSALHWVLLALGLGAVTAHVVVPNLIRKQQGATLESFRAMNIVRLAAAEGAALLGTSCFMLSGHPLGAGVTLAMLGMALLLQFPTSERLDLWLSSPD